MSNMPENAFDSRFPCTLSLSNIFYILLATLLKYNLQFQCCFHEARPVSTHKHSFLGRHSSHTVCCVQSAVSQPCLNTDVWWEPLMRHCWWECSLLLLFFLGPAHFPFPLGNASAQINIRFTTFPLDFPAAGTSFQTQKAAALHDLTGC